MKLKDLGWIVEQCNHAKRQFARKSSFKVLFEYKHMNRKIVTTNHLEKVWGVLGAMIQGTYYYLSAQYTPLYAAEAAFRLTKGSSKLDIANRIENFFKSAVGKYKTLSDFRRDFAVPVTQPA